MTPIPIAPLKACNSTNLKKNSKTIRQVMNRALNPLQKITTRCSFDCRGALQSFVNNWNTTKNILRSDQNVWLAVISPLMRRCWVCLFYFNNLATIHVNILQVPRIGPWTSGTWLLVSPVSYAAAYYLSCFPYHNTCVARLTLQRFCCNCASKYLPTLVSGCRTAAKQQAFIGFLTEKAP